MPALPSTSDAAARHAPADPFHVAGVAANLQLVAAVALDVEEVVHAALALAQEHRKAAHLSGANPAITSGQRTSASSGTLGCSLRVKTIMPPDFAYLQARISGRSMRSISTG